MTNFNDCLEGEFPLTHKTEHPTWGMSLLQHGSMRFRWNEKNPNRIAFLDSLSKNQQAQRLCQVELIHSKIVYDVNSPEELEGKTGDGIITTNKNLIPVVTVADCMPIFIYEPDSGVFGMLHSGWKGTGIVEEAILLANKKYGAVIENFRVVLGPHINSCCYNVDKNRAQYFIDNFGSSCVQEIPLEQCKNPDFNWALSLKQANLNILHKLNIPDSNIFASSECTSCFCSKNEYKYGSHRRQTFDLPLDLPLEERSKRFTVQVAWVKW